VFVVVHSFYFIDLLKQREENKVNVKKVEERLTKGQKESLFLSLCHFPFFFVLLFLCFMLNPVTVERAKRMSTIKR
jgi:hypothetical protein